MKNRNLILGLATGIAGGALLGILVAPENGLSTRRRINRKSKEVINGVGNKFEDMFSGIKKTIASPKFDTSHLIENNLKKATDIKDSFFGKVKESKI